MVLAYLEGIILFNFKDRQELVDLKFLD